jgi:ankyrin repeat protein
VHENTDVLLLSVAMEEQLATVIQVLLDNGADVHANNDEALRCAARDGYEEIVLALLARGANVHANGDEALRWAIYHEQVNIVRLLLAHGADGNAANGAALRETIMNQSDDSNILQMLLASGVDVHANNDEALRLAALYGRPSVIITLLDSVADFTKDCIDQVLRLAKLHRCGELIERKLLEYKNQHLAGADNVEVGAEPDNKRARLQ